MIRSDDGSIAADPRAAAARLQVESPGWHVWYGNASHLLNATHPDVPAIVQAATVAAMAAAIRDWQLTIRRG